MVSMFQYCTLVLCVRADKLYALAFLRARLQDPSEVVIFFVHGSMGHMQQFDNQIAHFSVRFFDTPYLPKRAHARALLGVSLSACMHWPYAALILKRPKMCEISNL